MSLAIFDLDNTLIGGDSDHLWGEFLVECELVDAHYYREKNDQFYTQYQAGTLDISEYLRFALAPLARLEPKQLQQLRKDFMQRKIEPILLPKAFALIDKHRQAGATLLIITATNDFITAPIAQRLGIDHLLASEAEQQQGRYTGLPKGLPCFQEGKVERLEIWLAEHKLVMQDSYFYSDSANDIPLLERVDKPVAVDPDERLARYAEQNGWPIISLR